jgi:Tfp pilus assembly protein FimT
LRRRGFSLLEALVAAGLIAAIALIASGSFLQLGPKALLTKATWQLNAHLNSARYKAIFEGTPVKVEFRQGGYSIKVYDASENTWMVKETCFLEGVDVQSNNDPIFHPTGTVSNLASIYVSNSRGKYKITLAISGRIKTVLL